MPTLKDMPSNQAHLENAERNRERILNVACQLMSERGFAGATIAEICKRADVMPPTLYWHFGDKQGLAAAAMERAAELWTEEFLPREGDRVSPRPDAVARVFRDRPEFLRLLLVLALESRDATDPVRDAIRRVRERGKGAWSGTFEPLLAGIKGPQERRRAANLLSEFALAQMDGVFIAALLNPAQADVQALIDLVGVTVEAAAAHLVERQGSTSATE